MCRAFFLSRAFLAISIMCIAAGCGPATDSSKNILPKYKFKLGRELVYRVTSDKSFLDSGEQENTEYGSETEWHVYPIRQSANGDWRLLIRKSYQRWRWPSENQSGDLMYWIRRGIREGAIPQSQKPEITFHNEFMGYCDLRPDGTFEKNDSQGSNASFQLQPEDLFCHLPMTETEIESGWQYDTPLSGEHYSFHIATTTSRSDASNDLELVGKVSTAEDANYGLQTERTFIFDAQRGVIKQIKQQGSYDYSGKKSRFSRTIELVSEEQHEESRIATLANESEEYFAKDRQWWDAMQNSDLVRTKAECKAVMDKLRNDLVESQSRATLAEVRQLYLIRLKLHDHEASNAVEAAAHREELYARPPIDWETTDFADQPQRSVDYRGKVVVMDFWYRGCVHCIKALPKVKQVAAMYADQPVVVIGVNNDSVDENARFVINTYELKYPIIRNGNISESYGVDGWPTFIVFDQSGRVALILFGNHDNLVQLLSQTIDGLLATPVLEAAL